MKYLFLVLTLFLSFSVLASNYFYYPEGFESQVKSGSLKEQKLKDSIFTLLTTPHARVAGKNDTLGNCTNNCVKHTVLGYNKARQVMFGQIDLKKDARGYYLRDVYCHNEIVGSDIGPNKIPSATVVNCEHTWPQSKFTSKFNTEMQKSDLNHLFTTNSKANSTRGNNPFGEVKGKTPGPNCLESSYGYITNKFTNSQILVFEPPNEQKGNTARALFYFSVRYKLPIDQMQEETLKQWNKDDPVDEEEMTRNDMVEKAQGSRNPFIDFPEMANLISDF